MSLFGQASGNTLRGRINRLTELRGYSAYEVAVINGYDGTEEEWLESIYGLSESWAVGGTGLREGEDIDNAKYWAEQARSAAGGGVVTFNGRDGSVVPQSGDYTAAMVGAIPASEKGAPNGVAELGDEGKVPVEHMPSLDDYGAVSKGGDTMTGTLVLQGKSININRGGEYWSHGLSLKSSDGSAALAGFGFYGYGDEVRNAYIGFDGNYTPNNTFSVTKDAVKFMDKAIFGEHNKPSGTYRGNGDATSRTIDIGGLTSRASLISISPDGGGWNAIIGRYGGFCYYRNGDVALQQIYASSANFYGGVLTIASTHAALNLSAGHYNYQVL